MTSREIDVTISRKIFNPVYLPFLENNKYLQVFFGGSSSGKSVFLAQRVVYDLMKGVRNYLCLRKYKTDLRDSSFSEIVKFITSKNLGKLFEITESRMSVKCINGSEAMFAGLDDEQKIKSITPGKGVITDIWIEEATQTTKSDFKELQKRLRGESVDKRITLSFNPILSGHWIEKELFTGWVDSKNFYEDYKKFILRTTYKDNRFLTDQDRELLESESDKYYYDVYTLGKWGLMGNVIFKNWRVEDLSVFRRQYSGTVYGGVDFGFASSPAAGLSVGIDKEKKKIYVFDECGGSGMTNQELAVQLEGLLAGNFTCDSAEPKSIEELRVEGISCQGADKGKDSVRYGIKWLQKYEIIVDENCRNLAREIPGYKWRETRSGEVVEQPVEKNDHWIDALRYAVEPIHNYELLGGGRINVAVLG